MVRVRRLLVFVGALSAALVAVPAASPAGAAPPPRVGHQSSVADQVTAALRLNPGSRQVGTNQVELEPGVVMTVPTAAGDGVSAQGTGSCPSGWLCFWEHANFEGYSISFYYCNQQDLRRHYMPNGNDWAYDISSWHDAQTGSAYATLWDGQTWLARTNQPRYNSWVGIINDRASWVWVC